MRLWSAGGPSTRAEGARSWPCRRNRSGSRADRPRTPRRVPSTTPPCATGSSAWSRCCDGWPSPAPAPSATPVTTWASSPSSTWPTRARSGARRGRRRDPARPRRGPDAGDVRRAVRPHARGGGPARGRRAGPRRRPAARARPGRPGPPARPPGAHRARRRRDGRDARGRRRALGARGAARPAPGSSTTPRPARTSPPASPLDPDLVAVLAGWADRHLRVEHTRGDDWIAPTGPGTALVPAPALVARRRGAAALRTFYDAIVADLADTERPLPGRPRPARRGDRARRPRRLARPHRARRGARRRPALPAARRRGAGPHPEPAGPRLGRRRRGPAGHRQDPHDREPALRAARRGPPRARDQREGAGPAGAARQAAAGDARPVHLAGRGSPTAATPGSARASPGLEARSTEFDPDEADRTIAELAERRDGLRADRDAALDALVAERARRDRRCSATSGPA